LKIHDAIKDYQRYIYDKDKKIPPLSEVRGKIAIYTRKDYKYNNKTIGQKIDFADMGGMW